MNVLITGGAGFIGSFVADALLKKGYTVTCYDNLDPQVHHGSKMPGYANKKANYVIADVRDYDALKKEVLKADMVIHLASSVGVAQSNEKIRHYVDNTELGTANLFDILVNNKNKVQKVIIGTSMTSYGEGAYECKRHSRVRPMVRTVAEIEEFGMEPVCPVCRREITAVPTREDDIQNLNSIYSLNKYVQEKMARIYTEQTGIPTVCLKMFNIYGPRQSLTNPYTGVTAIFLSMILAGETPKLFEDGLQTRDFLFVEDAADAYVKALEADLEGHHVINLGSGIPLTIKDVALKVAGVVGKEVEPELVLEDGKYKYRIGDIRHCFADASKAKEVLNWEPSISFEQGIQKLVDWGKKDFTS
ncbi:NAD-dependent epimerase/dehydratase family protein [Nanoarchaeota archaeon]